MPGEVSGQIINKKRVIIGQIENKIKNKIAIIQLSVEMRTMVRVSMPHSLQYGWAWVWGQMEEASCVRTAVHTGRDSSSPLRGHPAP